MFERRYRRTRSTADRRDWINEIRRKRKLYASKQNSYWEDKIASSRGKPTKLWANLSAVLRLKKAAPTALDGLSADSFSAAFTAKTDSVRSSTLSAPGLDFNDLPRTVDYARLSLSMSQFSTRTVSSIRLRRGS